MSSGKLPDVPPADPKIGETPEQDDSLEDEVEIDEDDLIPPRRTSSHFIAGHEGREEPIKIIGPNDEVILPEDIVVAPDGGWGWVIVFAAFMSNLIVDGTVLSFGLIQDEILKDTTRMEGNQSIHVPSQDAATVAWVGSIQAGFYLSAGPFVSAVLNVCGFRITSMIGSVVSALGFFLAWFFCRNGDVDGPNMPALFAFYGFFGGVGFCLLYVPSLIAVGYYFEKRRALATGIAVAGSGCGSFIFAPIIRALIVEFKWPRTILIQGGILLSSAFVVSLYRPLHPVKRAVVAVIAPNADGSEPQDGVSVMPSAQTEGAITSIIVKVRRGTSGELETIGSMTSTNSYDNNPSLAARSLASVHDHVERAPGSTTDIIPIQRTVSKKSVGARSTHAIRDHHKKMMASAPNIAMASAQNIAMTAVRTGSKTSRLTLELALERERHSGDEPQLVPPEGLPSVEPPERPLKLSLISSASTASNKSVAPPPVITLLVDSDVDMAESRVFRVASKNTLNRPLYRSHIFYAGDLEKFSERNENDQNVPVVEWEASPVIESPESEGGTVDAEQSPKVKRRRKWKCCRLTVLKKMLDFSLLKSCTFLLLAWSGAFAFLAFFVPFIYLKSMASEVEGIDDFQATSLLMIIGISNTVGRGVCGYVADKLNTRVLIINNLALTVGGLGTALIPFASSYPVFAIYAFLFGLSIAGFISLRTILTVELIGLNKLNNGIGLLFLFEGIASFIGSPMAGYLKDATGDYNLSFHVAGSMMLISAVMCYPLHIINAWEKKRKARRHRLKHRPSVANEADV